jgi:death on curing protein
VTVYISPAEAARIHVEIMARAGARSDLLGAGKLESALLRPANAAYYDGADLHVQAAALVVGIALAHAFGDGNKRLAAALGVIFLHANNVVVTGPHLELADEVLHIVNRTSTLGAATERFAGWLRAHSSVISPPTLLSSRTTQ